MTHPQTVKQYRKFFTNLGISHLEIKEKFGDLRKRETWERAYSDYTYPNLPIIKAIDEAIAQKAVLAIPECAETPVVEVMEVSEVVENEAFPTESLMVYFFSCWKVNQAQKVPTPRPIHSLPRPNCRTRSKKKYGKVRLLSQVNYGLKAEPKLTQYCTKALVTIISHAFDRVVVGKRSPNYLGIRGPPQH
ncbi:MAG: hypothetical protein QNJ68_03480 [Microcoleaceae cyanobacterium MO_207.B10]|nr:hypothetical protein [Microcoleaceae cyanobacterium MO_207.B10]